MKIAGILMASGLSRRFKSDKAFLKFQGTTFIQSIITKLLKCEFYEIKVVASQKIAEFIEPKFKNRALEIVLNHEQNLGQSHTIKIGINSCSEVDGFMFVTLDQPLLSVQTISSLITNFQKNTILVPKFGGICGSPKIFGVNFKQELLALQGDVGGKDIAKNSPCSLRFLDIKEPNEGFDIDRRQDYDKLIKGEL